MLEGILSRWHDATGENSFDTTDEPWNKAWRTRGSGNLFEVISKSRES